MKKYLGYLVFIVLFIIGAFYSQLRMKYNQSAAFDTFKTRTFVGKVIDKSRETSNHNYPYIRIQPDFGILYFELDLSNFFDSVQVGDDVLKLPNSDTVWIIREGVRIPYIVDFGCQ
jgi:hypothetical protein